MRVCMFSRLICLGMYGACVVVLLALVSGHLGCRLDDAFIERALFDCRGDKTIVITTQVVGANIFHCGGAGTGGAAKVRSAVI